MVTILATITRKGCIALYEEKVDGRSATIVTTPLGKSFRAYFKYKRRKMTKGRQAVVPVFIGDLVLKARKMKYSSHWQINIYKITDTYVDDNGMPMVDMDLLYSKVNGKWSDKPPTFLDDAIKVLEEKITSREYVLFANVPYLSD